MRGRYNYGTRVPQPTILDYFASEAAFRQVLQAAADRAKSEREKAFIADLQERVAQHRMGVRFSSNQAAWLVSIARKRGRQVAA